MSCAAEEDPLKQAPRQATTSPSILESPFRLYLIASATGSVFARTPAACGLSAGVLACWRATARMHAACWRAHACPHAAGRPGVACGGATVHMHAAGGWACGRVLAHSGVQCTHCPLTRLAYNPTSRRRLSWAGLLHDRGQVGLASGHNPGDIRPSLAEVLG